MMMEIKLVIVHVIASNFQYGRVAKCKKCNVNVICLPTKDQEFTRTRLKCSCIPRSNGNLEMSVFEERGKSKYPEKSLSEQGREPTTNSTHI